MAGEVGSALSWVLREATTNVLRHSNATHCQLKVTRDDEHLFLLLTNDGVSGTPFVPRTGGNGIPGMRERMESVGGSVSAGLEEVWGLCADRNSTSRRRLVMTRSDDGPIRVFVAEDRR